MRTASASVDGPLRFELRTEVSKSVGLAVGTLAAADPLYLLSDSRGIAQSLATKLELTGIRTRVVEALPPTAKHVVLMNGLQSTTQQEASQHALGLFNQLRTCAETMRVEGQLLITVQDTGGCFAPSELDRSWGAGISAIARTASREWPQLEVKAIDLHCADLGADTLAETLFQEIVAGGLELEVGLTADGKRHTLEIDQAGVTEETLPLEYQDVLVVSGGARGIAAPCIIALAEKVSLRFVLLGRSSQIEEEPELTSLTGETEIREELIRRAKAGEKPAAINARVHQILAAREVRETLAKLKALGSQVRYVEVDVSDATAVADALTEVRRDWGEIHGIVHAAGVIRDREIVRMTPTEFETVYRAKVVGLQSLLSATREDQLKLLCCFSSLAARAGNPGQLNYNVANESLNKACVALKAERPECTVKSIAWGAWDGGMVTPALKRKLEDLGVDLIDRKAGSHAFTAEISAGIHSAVEVILTGTPGQALSLAPEKTRRQASVWFHESNFPFLKGHAIRDVPVAAMFFTIELAARFAQSIIQGRIVRAVNDVAVLKGIQLPGFTGQGVWVKMTATCAGQDTVAVEFHDSEGRLNYRFAVETGPDLEADRFAESPDAFGRDPWGWNIDRIYEDRLLLFHEGDFEVIRTLDRIDESSFKHEVAPGSMSRDSDHRWFSDVLMIDGAGQGCLLWAWWKHKHYALPAGIKSLRVHQSGLHAQSVTCYSRVVKDAPNESLFDVWLVDAMGNLVASMESLQMTYIPNSKIPESHKQPLVRLY